MPEMDFKKEAKRLDSFQEGGYQDRPKKPWFSPTTGIWKVHITEIGNVFTQEYAGETIEKVRLGIKACQDKVDKEEMIEYNWAVPKAKTKMSLYGQLVVLGNAKGTLSGTQFDLVVKEMSFRRKDGEEARRRDYTIPDAIRIMGEE